MLTGGITRGGRCDTPVFMPVCGRRGGRLHCWGWLCVGRGRAAVRCPQAEPLLSASPFPYIQRLHFHYSSPFRGTLS